MHAEKITPFPSPRDPRDPEVARSPDQAATEPPSDLFVDPEAPHLRLSYGYDAQTPEEMETLDIAEALQRLCDRHGVERVHNILKLIAIGRGVKL